MKNILVFFLIALCCVINIFSEESNIIERMNVFGGITVERVYNDIESAKTNYSKLIEYYDSERKIVKRLFESTDIVINRTGIKIQINHYRNDIIEKYEMFFSDEYKYVHGFNRLIEEVNFEDKVISSIWYNNDIILDISRLDENNVYEFFNIEFIENEFFSDYQPNERGDVITTSGRYFRIKSVVKFNSDLVELDNDDIKLMNLFARGFGLDDISHYYSKKIRVFSENNVYWLYVQTQLEQYILGQNATVSYYPIGKNKELYLICVGFYDIIDAQNSTELFLHEGNL
jgi:hypothetical protein